MSNKSKIEWTDVTWNPVTGCSKVSDGCKNCYAERMTARFRKDHKPWTLANAAHNVVLHYDRLTDPFHWQKLRKVFVNSMSDLFHELVDDDFILGVFNAMRENPRHTFQVLTKRPERMQHLLSLLRWPDGPAVAPNVWLGVSVENQQTADERIPLLLQTPAAVRFLSCEPLLGPLDLTRWLEFAGCDTDAGISNPGIQWVICGGESGPDARPMHPDWARSLRDQCKDAGVSYLFKQWGEFITAEVRDNPHFAGGRSFDYPDRSCTSSLPLHDNMNFKLWDRDHIAVRIGKTKAGRLLDGRTWDEYPQTAKEVQP